MPLSWKYLWICKYSWHLGSVDFHPKVRTSRPPGRYLLTAYVGFALGPSFSKYTLLSIFHFPHSVSFFGVFDFTGVSCPPFQWKPFTSFERRNILFIITYHFFQGYKSQDLYQSVENCFLPNSASFCHFSPKYLYRYLVSQKLLMKSDSSHVERTNN